MRSLTRPSARPSTRNRSRAGFSLIEVMVALLIVGFMMLSVTQILTVTRNSRDVIHNIQEKQLAGPAILSLLESDLRALTVYNRDEREALRIRDLVESGLDADTIDFVATTNSLLPFLPQARGDFQKADINEVGYRLRPNPDNDDFLELYRREDFGVDDEPFEGGRFALLHDRVKGLNIEVFDVDGPDAEPLEGWGSSNDENVGLPPWIRIDLTLELAPRLVREQLIIDRREVTYSRTIRLPSELQLALETKPVPLIPQIGAPIAPNAAGGPAAGAGGLQNPNAGGPGGGTVTTGTSTSPLNDVLNNGSGGGGGGSGGLFGGGG